METKIAEAETSRLTFANSLFAVVPSFSHGNFPVLEKNLPSSNMRNGRLFRIRDSRDNPPSPTVAVELNFGACGCTNSCRSMVPKISTHTLLFSPLEYL